MKLYSQNIISPDCVPSCCSNGKRYHLTVEHSVLKDKSFDVLSESSRGDEIDPEGRAVGKKSGQRENNENKILVYRSQ